MTSFEEACLNAGERGGQPLPEKTRSFMEARFGQNFSGVRVHADDTAARLNRELSAQAFTFGRDIFFGAGKYGPATGAGRQLLAHELTHVVQQGFAARRQAARPYLTPRIVQCQPVATPTQKAPTSMSPPFSVEELRARYRLLDAALTRLEATHAQDPTGVAAIRKGLERSRWLQALIAASSGVLLPDDQLAHSSGVELAGEILDRVERILPQLLMQHAVLSKQSGAAPDSRAGYGREIRAVIDKYFQAVSRCLDADAQTAYDAAEAAAEALPRRLIEVDLVHFESKRPKYRLVEQRRQEMVAWAGWVRGEVDKLQLLAKAVRTARQNRAQNLTSLEADLAKQQALVELSIQGLAHWEQGLLAFEYLADEGNLIPTAYRSVGRILGRCADMRDAAEARDLNTLRQRVTAHASDPNVERFYRGLPVIAFGSRFLVQLGVTLVAAYVTAGVSSAVFGTGTAVTAGRTSLLATTGTAAVEALSFTLISRGMMAAIPGQPSPEDSLIADLIWNFGLFFVLRNVGSGIKKALDAKGLTALTSIATAAGAFPVLYVYGVLRHRVAKGAWPSDQELAMMTAQNIIMLAALTSGMRMMQGLRGSAGQPTALGRFHQKYGWRFEALDAARGKLESRVDFLSKSKSKISEAEVKDLQDKARVVEDSFKKVLEDVKADKSIAIETIRAELKTAGKMAPEGMSELLAREIGILTRAEEMGLRGAGTPRMFSYRWGGTGVLEKALRDVGAIVEKKADPDTGLRTLTAEMAPREPPLYFQERSELTPEHPVDLQHPSVVRLLNDFSITEAKAVRMAQILLEKELAKNPMPTEPIAKRLRGPVRVVRRYLTGLKAASKDPVQVSLTRAGPEARGSTATPALLAEAKRLAGSSLVKSDQWLSARTDEQFLGYLGEYLATGTAEAMATPQGARVLTGVRFRGKGFVDAARTQPALKSDGRPMIDTDVVSELDFLLVTEPAPGKFEYTTVMNAKVKKAASGALTGAQEQNGNALEALEAHVQGRVAVVKEKGKVVRYAAVDSIVGRDLGTGQLLELTGKLSSAGSIKQETLGPKGARGYTKALPYTHREMMTLMRIVREIEMVDGLGK